MNISNIGLMIYAFNLKNDSEVFFYEFLGARSGQKFAFNLTVIIKNHLSIRLYDQISLVLL